MTNWTLSFVDHAASRLLNQLHPMLILLNLLAIDLSVDWGIA